MTKMTKGAWTCDAYETFSCDCAKFWTPRLLFYFWTSHFSIWTPHFNWIV